MIFDILLILFAGGGFWLGYTKGLARTLFTVLCYIIALLLTLAVSPWIMDLIIRWFKADKLFALIFGTLAVLIIMIFLIHWMLRSVERYLKKSRIGAYSKSLGGVVMMLFSMIICSYLAWTIVTLGWVGEEIKAKSYSYPYMEQVPIRTRSFVEEFKPLFSRYWELMQQTVSEGDQQPVQLK